MIARNHPMPDYKQLRGRHGRAAHQERRTARAMHRPCASPTRKVSADHSASPACDRSAKDERKSAIFSNIRRQRLPKGVFTSVVQRGVQHPSANAFESVENFVAGYLLDQNKEYSFARFEIL